MIFISLELTHISPKSNYVNVDQNVFTRFIL